MRLAVLLMLPGVALLGGCHALTRNAEVIDYRPGGTTTMTVAGVDGSYRLAAPDAHASWIETDLPRGAAVGFRREADGSVVAVAGDQTWRFDEPNGRHVWLYTPKPRTAADRIVVGARDRSETAVMTLGMILTAPFWLPRCATTGVWP